MPFNASLAKAQGAFLQETRLSCDIKVKDAAITLTEMDGTSTSSSAWSNYEQGIRHPSTQSIQNMAKILGVSRSLLAWDFLSPGDKNPVTELEQEMIDRDIDIQNTLSHTVQDDSMAPEINKNDHVAVEKGLTEIAGPTLILFGKNKHSLKVRYIKPEGNGQYSLYCSGMEGSPDETLDNLESLSIIGKVISVTRWIN